MAFCAYRTWIGDTLMAKAARNRAELFAWNIYNVIIVHSFY